MEAINFSEFTKRITDDVNRDSVEQLAEIFQGVSIYSQSFSVDLVEKYFENVTRVSLGNGTHKIFIQGVEITIFGNYNYWIQKDTTYETFQVPLTLNDFIRDCQRMRRHFKVNLIFSEAAIKALNIKERNKKNELSRGNWKIWGKLKGS